jgi:CBS domain-containing protein
MKVREIMKSEPRVCWVESTLAEAGRIMADAGCGFLPVLSQRKVLMGVVTDRDICLAATAIDRKPSEITVQQVISGEAYTCKPDEEVEEALHTMQVFGIRRLPVVDEDDRLEGILSLDDVVLAAKALGNEAFTGPFYSDVARTLKAICSHPMQTVVG